MNTEYIEYRIDSQVPLVDLACRQGIGSFQLVEELRTTYWSLQHPTYCTEYFLISYHKGGNHRCCCDCEVGGSLPGIGPNPDHEMLSGAPAVASKSEKAKYGVIICSCFFCWALASSSVPAASGAVKSHEVGPYGVCTASYAGVYSVLYGLLRTA